MQLPQVNTQYPPTEGVEDFTSSSSLATPPLCALCGQRGVFKCSACKVAQYCSKEHQKDHWSHGHKADCAKWYVPVFGNDHSDRSHRLGRLCC
jgi:pre-rRNA-processing protein TSR4